MDNLSGSWMTDGVETQEGVVLGGEGVGRPFY
jgi:hypothetical protein